MFHNLRFALCVLRQNGAIAPGGKLAMNTSGGGLPCVHGNGGTQPSQVTALFGSEAVL